MARDAIDVKEALSAKIRRKKTVQRCDEVAVLCQKEDPGNITAAEALQIEEG